MGSVYRFQSNKRGVMMRGSSNVRKYLAQVEAQPKEASDYSCDYRQAVINTLNWMLVNSPERPMSAAPASRPAAMKKPKPVRAMAFPKAQQVVG